jgi:membrane-associated HD superfamily phosphohydrolase
MFLTDDPKAPKPDELLKEIKTDSLTGKLLISLVAHILFIGVTSVPFMMDAAKYGSLSPATIQAEKEKEAEALREKQQKEAKKEAAKEDEATEGADDDEVTSDEDTAPEGAEDAGEAASTPDQGSQEEADREDADAAEEEKSEIERNIEKVLDESEVGAPSSLDEF